MSASEASVVPVKGEMQQLVIASIIGCLIAMYIFKMLNPPQEKFTPPCSSCSKMEGWKKTYCELACVKELP